VSRRQRYCASASFAVSDRRPSIVALIVSSLFSPLVVVLLRAAELSTLWRVRKTIHAMLNERGYLLTQEDMKMTLDEFKDKFGENPPYVDRPTAPHRRTRDAAAAQRVASGRTMQSMRHSSCARHDLSIPLACPCPPSVAIV
jgi:hypothetical protein